MGETHIDLNHIQNPKCLSQISFGMQISGIEQVFAFIQMNPIN